MAGQHDNRIDGKARFARNFDLLDAQETCCRQHARRSWSSMRAL